MKFPNVIDTIHANQNIAKTGKSIVKMPLSIGNELKRLKTIQFTLKNHSEIITSFPEFASTMDKLDEITHRISGIYSNIKEKLINLSIKIANGLHSYGVMTDNEELISISSVKLPSLNALNDTDLLKRENLILDCAQRYFSSLCYFGVQMQTLLDFKKNKEIFSYITGSSGTDVFESTPWKQEIDNIYNDAAKLIEGNIDAIMEQIKAKHPKFYLEYIAAKLT